MQSIAISRNKCLNVFFVFHKSGSEEVMFIHTHYSRFAEIFSRAEEPDPHQQEKIEKRLAFVF